MGNMARTATEICKDYNRNRQIRQGVIELTDGNMQTNIKELFEVDQEKARDFCVALSKDINADPGDFFETGRVRQIRA
jgi:hypothetical protein